MDPTLVVRRGLLLVQICEALFKVAEIGLVFAVVYHSVNGVRVILVDFWEAGTKHQRGLFVGSVICTAVIFIPTAAIMASRLFAH